MAVGSGGNNPDPSPNARLFSALIEAKVPGWKPFDVDYENHWARGILHARTSGHLAHLSHAPASQTARLQVQICGCHVDPDRRTTLDRVQAATRLARIIPDSADDIVLIQTVSLYLFPGDAPVVLSAMLEEITTVLNHEQTLGLIKFREAESVAGGVS